MKKSLFILPLVSVALVACGKEEEKQPDMFATCEQIEVTDEHLVYKCPSTLEWIAAVKAVEPNGVFKTGGNLNLAELFADTENTYVEVALNDAGKCAEDFTVRTMIAEPKEDAMWAVIGCK